MGILDKIHSHTEPCGDRQLTAQGARHMNMESLYEYGSRAGFWRLHRMFTARALAATVFAVGMALEKNPAAARAMADAGWEVGPSR